MNAKLDLKDKKILQILELDARMSLTQLAQKVKLSKQVVKYRVERLEKENIIQCYNALIDVENLGNSIYVVYLKLFKLKSDKENDWFIKINEHKKVLGLGRNQGPFDLTIPILAKNNQEFDSTLNDIFKGYNQYIKEKLITTEIHSTYNLLDLLNINLQKKQISTQKQASILKIDNKDEIILDTLSKNARISLVELANKVNMTANGVKNKIKNLEKNKIIIGYKTKINYEKLGFLHFRVLLKLENYTQEKYDEFKKFLISQNNVESLGHYTGFADIDFRCYSKSMMEFNEFIIRLKDEFVEEIIEVNSMLIFDWNKIKYY